MVVVCSGYTTSVMQKRETLQCTKTENRLEHEVGDALCLFAYSCILELFFFFLWEKDWVSFEDFNLDIVLFGWQKLCWTQIREFYFML